MFKKDSYELGILIGIVFPLICFGILYGIKIALGNLADIQNILSQTKMMFASSALNVIPIRYLYVSRELPRSAQGVLLVTVVMIFTVFFAF